MQHYRISPIHLVIAEEHEKFVSHNLKLLLTVSIPGTATLSTPEHAGHAMALCGAVAIYLVVASYRVMPSAEWWQSQGQGQLFKSARLTWLVKPENRLLAIAIGLTVTAGLWFQAALDLMKIW